MKVFKNLSITYRLRKSKDPNLKGAKVIYCRVTLDTSRADFSTKQRIAEKQWCNVTERVKGSSQSIETINLYLDSLTKQITDLYLKYRGSNSSLNLVDIKENIFRYNENSKSGLKEASRGFNYVVGLYIKDIEEKERVGIITKGTFKCYRASINSLLEYVNLNRVGSSEIDLKIMDKQYFYGFEKFLLTIKKMNKNSTHKVLKHTRRIFTYAYNNGWINSKPEIWFNVKYVNPPRPLLTIEEIKVLMCLQLVEKNLEETLDCFLFQVFSGLSYQELKTLNNRHIKHINGRYWIIIKRKKTGNEQKLILLPEALKIVQKYNPNIQNKDLVALLPVKSNQKYNVNLKTLQSLAGIETKMSSHLGRHVFATTIALSNGMPLETVSKILGHTSMKTTQIYAKVLDDKIALDFDSLSLNLSTKI
jgi:site-specific recombinase XerD